MPGIATRLTNNNASRINHQQSPVTLTRLSIVIEDYHEEWVKCRFLSDKQTSDAFKLTVMIGNLCEEPYLY